MSGTVFLGSIPFLLPTLRQATPLVLAGAGGILSERAGVVNIALEGMMLTGAFVGVWAGESVGLFGGVAAALIAGGLLGLFHYLATQKLRVNHIVSGVAINLLAVHGTTFLLRRVYTQAQPPREADLTHTIDPLLFVSLAVLVLIAVHFALYRTPFGLRLRSVGESPLSARMAGLNPARYRLAGVVLSGILAAAAGTYLAVSQIGRFSDDMVAGRGYIALAAVICGRWKPIRMAAAALTFGFFDALQMRMQSFGGLPVELSQSLPYILAIAAAAAFRSAPPAALGREEE